MMISRFLNLISLALSLAGWANSGGGKKSSVSAKLFRYLNIIGLLAIGSSYSSAYAAPTPYACDGVPYTMIDSPSTMQSFNTATLAVTDFPAITPAGTNVNGIGFNNLDNFIYGIRSGTGGGFGNKEIIRVGANSEAVGLGTPTYTGAGSVNWAPQTNNGTFDTAGNYYILSKAYVYKVNVGTNPTAGNLTFTAVARTGITSTPNDITFSVADGNLYGSSSAGLLQINPNTGATTSVTYTGTLGAAGGAWSTASDIYFYSNGGGILYVVNGIGSGTPVASIVGNPTPNPDFDAAACIPPSLKKDASVATTAAGSSFDYTYTIINPYIVSLPVDFEDVLPTNLSYDLTSLTPNPPGGGTITTFNSTDLNISNITIPANSQLSFTVTVNVDLSTPAGEIDNQATITFGSTTLESDDPDTNDIDDPTTVAITAAPPSSSPPPFVCNNNFYEVVSGQLSLLDPVTGLYSGIGSTQPRYNATGYNVLDNYIYGIGQDSPISKKLVRIGSDGSYEVIGDVPGLSFSGAVGLNNDYYHDFEASTIKYIDLNNPAAGETTLNFTGSAGSDFLDGSYISSGGKDYIVGAKGGKLGIYNITDGIASSVAVSGLGSGGYGATWSTSDGRFYASQNSTGTIFIVDDVFSASPTVIGTSAAQVTNNHDGMNCYYGGAPVGPPTASAEDFSDAPLTGTTYGDPSHTISSGIQIGAAVTSEASGYDDANAAGDADDGVTLPTLTQGASDTISVVVNQVAAGDGYLQGWIDWDGNGSFDAGEQIASNLQLPSGTSGTIDVSVTVPATATTNPTFARFRWSTTSSLNSTTAASDGEVEDYALTIAAGGSSLPTFACDSNFFETIDGQLSVFDVATSTYTPIGPDQEHYNATGFNVQDNYIYGIGREGSIDNRLLRIGSDGSYELVAGIGSVSPASSGTFNLNNIYYHSFLPTTMKFIDLANPAAGETTITFSGNTGLPVNREYADGAFMQYAGKEYIVAAKDGVLGIYNLTDMVITTKAVAGFETGSYGAVWATADGRFYASANNSGTIYAIDNVLSGTPTIAFTVSAATSSKHDGMNCYGGGAPFKDYSDAPTSGTAPDGTNTSSYGETSHDMGDLQLGAAIDADAPAIANATASGDGSDDDGVTLPALTQGGSATIPVVVTQAAANDGYLQGWIDWDGNGSFDAGEQIASNLKLASGTSGTINVSVTVPATATTNPTFARFRWSTTSSLNSTTAASDGEVEDYVLTVAELVNLTPLSCNSDLYQYYRQSSSPDVYTLSNYNVATASYDSQFTSSLYLNALGFNPVDNLIYGVEVGGSQELYKMDTAGNQVSLGVSVGLNIYAGDVDDAGTWYGFDGTVTGNTIYTVDTTAATPTVSSTTLASDNFSSVADFAFNSGDGLFYGLQSMGAGAFDLLAYNPASNTLTRQSLSGDIVGVGGAIGALWYTTEGFIYGYKNTTGTIYRIDPFTLITYEVGTGPAGLQRNDGTSCRLASPFSTLDYSDAPASYGDATHKVNAGIQLGAAVDSEASSLASANADGDGADDDAINVFPVLTPDNNNYQLSITATNNTSSPGRLIAWIDFDGNGSFDADEAGARVVPAGTTNGSFLVTWASIPTDIQAGKTFMRVRLTTGSLNAGQPSGDKPDGEVEDYAITIGDPDAKVSGRVYIDANSSATEDASEAGIGGTVVVLRDTVAGTCRSVTTNANGYYSFPGTPDGNYQIYQAHGEITPMPQSCGAASANNPTGYQSTTPDTLTITVSGADIADQDFGEVAGTNSPTSGNTGAGITFEPDHQGDVLPGNTTFYAHTFSTEADGGVSFTTADSGNTATGWTNTLYLDADCNGVLNGSEGNTSINGMNVGVTAGSKLCIIDKVYAPSNVPAQDQYEVKIIATFTYTGGAIAPAVLEVTDLTRAGQTVTPTTQANPPIGESRLELIKTVENLTQATPETETLNQAKPGDILKYRLYYRNTGTGPITDLKVDDKVPAFTGYISTSSACDITPLGMVCTPVVNLDELSWGFTGSLVGGAFGSVSYEVMLDN